MDITNSVMFEVGRRQPEHSRYAGMPILEIIEQPQSRGYRFRYECEGSTHGNISGASSNKKKKTQPSIRISNWPGSVRITVFCVTNEEPYQPHTHELLGKNCTNGRYIQDIAENNAEKPIIISGLSIKHSTKKRAIDVLTLRFEERFQQQKKLDSIGVADLTEAEKNQAREEAKSIAPHLDLSVVRLLFRAELIESSQVKQVLEITSEPIYDAKAPGAAALRICRMDKTSGSCNGGEEIFLLCDKVQKDDIAVSFQEYDMDGQLKWEEYGKFGPQDVHRQYAIVFRTPPYHEANIKNPVQVKVKLKRIQRLEESNPVTFTYHPEQQDEDHIVEKKRKKLNHVIGNHGGFPYTADSNCISNKFELPVQMHPVMHYDSQQQGSALVGHQMPLHQISQIQSKSPGHNSYAVLQNQTFLPSFKPGYSDMIDHPTSINNSVNVQNIHSGRINEIQSLSPYNCLISRGLTSHPNFYQKVNEPIDLKLNEPIDLRLKTDAGEEECNSLTDIQRSILEKFMLEFEDAMFAGLEDYAQTGDERFLLLVHANLLITQNAEGDSLLHMAVINKQMQVMRALLSVLSSHQLYAVDQRNHLKQTALHLACILHDANAVDLLVSYGASLSAVDRDGNTAVHLAVKHGALGCLDKLLSCKTKAEIVNMQNFAGLAPLHIAVMKHNIQVIEALVVMGGANINIQDGCSGQTPLHYAVLNDMLAVVGYLVTLGDLEVNKADYSGAIPLHLALQKQSVGCTSLLMSRGADPNIEIIQTTDVADEEISDDEYSQCTEPDEDVACEGAQGILRVSGWTLAKDNPQMENLLKCQMFSADQTVLSNKTFDSKVASKISFSESDIYNDIAILDKMTRIKLSKLLDPLDEGHDWRTLALLVNMESLLDTIIHTRSPTLNILNKCEADGITLQELTEALRTMGRHDAIKIIAENITEM